MREKEEAYRILEAALSIASTSVDEAEVSLRGGELGLIRFADNQLHPAGIVVHERLALRLGRAGRWARASTSDLSTAGITVAAQQARTELERLPEGPGGETFPAPQSYAEVDAYDAATSGLHALERIAIAARPLIAAHRAGVTASGWVAIRRGGLGLDGHPRLYAIANTRGLLAYHPSSRAELEVQMASEHRVGRARQSSVTIAGLDPRAAVERALWTLDRPEAPASLPPGRYVAVLQPTAVSALVRVIGREAGAARLERGESFLAGRLGQSVVDPRIDIVDDHRHPDHAGMPFDADGVARQRVPIIEKGVAKSPVVAWCTHLRHERPPTGHRVEGPLGAWQESAEHLVMSGGDGTAEDLIVDVGAGVAIGGFDGVTLIDPRTLRVTGSTAYGTFAIERGAITAPVGELRFDVSILDLLSRVRGLGAPVWQDGAVVPPMVVEGLPLYAST